MPFTPYHFGPGLLFKSLLQGSFSLVIFAWAQIVMDIQPLLVLLTGKGHLHGFTHTLVGATLLAVFSAVSGKYGIDNLLNRWPNHVKVGLLVSWPTAVLSALIGCYSHVVLDAIMHGDLLPFAPFNTNNPMLHMLSVNDLHWLCVTAGAAGAILYFLVLAWHRQARKP
ncbi:hypothetical protein [Teredinibacter turnerae]|uniref:hypothetical protein n=1 Tax=Teredinibacter turnerae TaxID=2426 RepID=UPI00037CE0E1|nr:hypothetical protein [Teredinibacter turnerae]